MLSDPPRHTRLWARRRDPVLRITAYDRISSLMMTIVLGLIVFVLSVVSWWGDDRSPDTKGTDPRPVKFLPGESNDYRADSMPALESPAEPVLNASLTETEFDQVQVAGSLSAVVELAERAAELFSADSQMAHDGTAIPGSSFGDANRSLDGIGQQFGREQRWYVHFGDVQSIDEYARQLESLGIELGAILPEGEVVYLMMGNGETPKIRTAGVADGDARLHMAWQGASRRATDERLFRRAGVDFEDAPILHFYSAEAEATLARLEREYANRDPEQIRRTYFAVSRQGGTYRFTVTRQTYVR